MNDEKVKETKVKETKDTVLYSKDTGLLNAMCDRSVWDFVFFPDHPLPVPCAMTS